MKYLGLFLAMAAIAGLGVYVALLMSSMGDELESLRSENVRLREQIDQLARQGDQLTDMEAQVDNLLAQVHDANAELAKSAVTADPTVTEAPAQPDPETGQTANAADEKEAPLAAMMKMFQGEQGSKMREASAKMTVDMQYAQLLKQLALPPDVDQQVRDILMGHAMTEIERGMSMMENVGKQSGKDLRAEGDAATEALRTQLSQVLTADELAEWEVYEADKERHVMEQSFDMQLNMFGSGMDEETRLTLRDTLVDQILAGQEAQALSDEPVEMLDHVEQQQAAFNRTRELLAPVLTEEQFQQADRFITQQEDMLRVSMEMMEGMFDSGNSQSLQSD